MHTRFLPSAFAGVLFTALCTLSAAATAQRTIIVDSQGRPGTEFLDLQPAIDEANPGDILLVRDGSYSAATMDKGIQIHALPGAVLNGTRFGRKGEPLFVQWLRIVNVPASERAVVKGLEIRPPGGLGFSTPIWLEVVDCAGLVHLESITITGPPYGYFPSSPLQAALSIRGSSRVALSHCTTDGLGGLWIERSAVSAQDSSFRGAGRAPSAVPSFWNPAAAGVTLASGSLILSRCDVTGGGGTAPGIACGGDLLLTGDASTSIVGGAPAFSAPGEPAIVGTDSTGRWWTGIITGTVRLDPIVQLVPGTGAPAIGPGLPVTTETIPSLSVTGAPLGGTVQGDLRADPGAPFGVLLGLPASPLATPFGALWLDPLTSLAVLAGALDPSGTVQWSVGVPTLEALRGAILTWQGIALTANGLRLSNPGQHVIDG